MLRSGIASVPTRRALQPMIDSDPQHGEPDGGHLEISVQKTLEQIEAMCRGVLKHTEALPKDISLNAVEMALYRVAEFRKTALPAEAARLDAAEKSLTELRERLAS